jgi:hypothetical protein
MKCSVVQYRIQYTTVSYNRTQCCIFDSSLRSLPSHFYLIFLFLLCTSLFFPADFLHVSFRVLQNGCAPFRTLPWTTHKMASKVSAVHCLILLCSFSLGVILFISYCYGNFFFCTPFSFLFFAPFSQLELHEHLTTRRYGLLNELSWKTVLNLPPDTVLRKHPLSTSRMHQ